jgi:O-succinylbenzoic acid--CoA ligase
MGGLAPVFRSALYGTSVVVQQGFDAEGTAVATRAHGATGISLVPTMLRRIFDADALLADSLRFVLLGGAPAPHDLIAECERRDVPVHPTYGTTETASQIATATPAEAFERPGTAGRPLLGTDVTIVDDDGDPLGEGEVGEIVVAGPTVAPGYDDPAATASAFGQYGFHTGDAGYLEDGLLWVTGRIDDHEQLSDHRPGAEATRGELDDAIRDVRDILDSIEDYREDLRKVEQTYLEEQGIDAN